MLEQSFIVYCLKPFFANWGKRLIQAPKRYFLDTGLLCYRDKTAAESARQRPEIVHVGCWAHIRREFYRLVCEQGSTCTAAAMIDLIRKLYQIERDLCAALAAGSLAQDTFVEERRARAAPIFEAIRS